MSTQLQFNSDARNKMKAGIDKVADAVKVTLGPKGRNVTIQQNSGQNPFITKDGVTVAQNVRTLSDPYEDSGAQMIKAVARKTAGEAGDGTTTSTVLTQYLITEGMKLVANGANPVELKRGMDNAVADVVANIKLQAKQIANDSQEVLSIATISANNDEEIGKHIADAVLRVGNDGLIQKQESRSTDTFVSVVSGLSIDKGYLSPAFITDKPKAEAILDNPLIMLCPDKLSTFTDILSVMEICTKGSTPDKKRSLLIICSDADSEALSTLSINTVRGNIKACAIRMPGYGGAQKEMLQDIAIQVGGTVIDKDLNMKPKDCTHAWLGSAEKVVVGRDSTTIIGGRGNQLAISERAEELRGIINGTEITAYERPKMEVRLAKLTSGMAVINVGGFSEIEVKEKMDRVDDALCATKAALEEGIVPGGGIAYLKAQNSIGDTSSKSTDEVHGYNLIVESLAAPLIQILKNAGITQSEISSIKYDICTSMAPNFGYNAKTNEYADLLATGVIDPAKVLRVSLENASSVAGMFLTTECAIVEVPEK